MLYRQRSASYKQKEQTENSLQNLAKGRDGAYNGYLSPATARSIRKFISAWLTALDFNIKRNGSDRNKCEYYPTFVTLTLPADQMHDDNFIKRHMLGRLIVRLKERYKIKYYFWRAEPQQNGNIHFHLLIDKYIWWQDLRKEWNAILNDYGYIDVYRQNMQAFHKNGFKLRKDLLKRFDREQKKFVDHWTAEKQLMAYKWGIQENWSNPNTTDIHAIENMESITAYVIKYMCKPSDNSTVEVEDSDGEKEVKSKVRKIQGRIWGCADELKKLKNFSDTLDITDGLSSAYAANSEMVNYVEQVEKEVSKDDVFEDEHVKVIRLRKPQIVYLKHFSRYYADKYINYYREMYRSLYNSKIQVELTLTV